MRIAVLAKNYRVFRQWIDEEQKNIEDYKFIDREHQVRGQIFAGLEILHGAEENREFGQLKQDIEIRIRN